MCGCVRPRLGGDRPVPLASDCRRRPGGSHQGRARAQSQRCARRTNAHVARHLPRRPTPVSARQLRMGPRPRSLPRRGSRTGNHPDDRGEAPCWRPRAPGSRRHGPAGSRDCPAQPTSRQPARRRPGPSCRPIPAQRSDADPPRHRPRPRRPTDRGNRAPRCRLRWARPEHAMDRRHQRPPQHEPHRGRRSQSRPRKALLQRCPKPHSPADREASEGRGVTSSREKARCRGRRRTVVTGPVHRHEPHTRRRAAS